MSVAGWEGALKVATTEAGLVGATAEAKVQKVAPKFGGNIKELYELGSRSPTEIKEGNIKIDLAIDVSYVAGSAWPSRAGVGATGALTEYYVGIYPQGYASGKPKIVLSGKFGDWNLDVAQDGELTQHVTFKGKTIAVGTVA